MVLVVAKAMPLRTLTRRSTSVTPTGAGCVEAEKRLVVQPPYSLQSSLASVWPLDLIDIEATARLCFPMPLVLFVWSSCGPVPLPLSSADDGRSDGHADDECSCPFHRFAHGVDAGGVEQRGHSTGLDLTHGSRCHEPLLLPSSGAQH